MSLSEITLKNTCEIVEIKISLTYKQNKIKGESDAYKYNCILIVEKKRV